MTQAPANSSRLVSITTQRLGPTYIGTLTADNKLIDWVRLDILDYPLPFSANSDRSYRVTNGEGALHLETLEIDGMCDIEPDFEERFRRETWIPLVEDYLTDPGADVEPDQTDDFLERARCGKIETRDAHFGSLHNQLFVLLAMSRDRMPHPKCDFLRWRLFEFLPPHWFDPDHDRAIVISDPQKEHTP